MSALVELYAERHRLREQRRALESKLEALVQPTAANARAINAVEQRRPKPIGVSAAAYAPPQT